jgi:uncharacterized membrane protein
MSARNAESGPSAGPLELLQVYFLAPLLLSLACQLYWLKPILDEDEQVTALTAMSDPAALWRWFHFDITHPPLHVLTLHNWIRFAGHSDSSLRAMSMLSSVVTLALFYLLARRFLPRSGAALACLLQGCSVFYVFYAREARPFSLTALWGIATLYLLTGIDGAVTTRRAVTYFLLCVGLVYSSYVGLLLIIAELLWIGFRVAADRPKLLIAGIAAALTVAPWAWTMMWPYDGLLMAHLSRLMPGPYDARWADIGAFYAHAVAGTFLRRTAYFLLPVAAVAIAPAARRLMAESKLQLLVLSAALPVVTLHVAARFTPAYLWATRHLVGSAAVFVLLVVIGLYEHRSAVLRLTLIVALLVASALTMIHSVRRYHWGECCITRLESPKDNGFAATKTGRRTRPVRKSFG